MVKTTLLQSEQYCFQGVLEDRGEEVVPPSIPHEQPMVEGG